MNRNFPFTGIAGHDHVKEALLCALVCDTIHSLLIIGSPGTAKSTLVRSVEALVEGKKVITIPQNITYDRLMGTINLELAMKSGSIEFSPGILSQGNNHILYVDDINRMDEGTLQCILTTSQNGQYVLEREGLSRIIISRFTLLASMDPQEGSLSSTHMDLFDLCVRTDRTCDIQTRAEIINRVLFFEQSPDEFICAYEKETEDLKTLLIKARERFPYVTIPEGHLDLITSLCIELGVEGYRGDLALARTAKALAALNQRDEVIFDDIKRAAILTLEHRRHECQSTSQQQSNSHSRDKERESDKNDRSSENQHDTSGISNYQRETRSGENQKTETFSSSAHEMYFDIGKTFEVIRYLGEESWRATHKQKTGRRSRVISLDSSGHYRSFRFPGGKCRNDIAIAPTLRAAALHQHMRDRNGVVISVKKSDLREKVREKKVAHTILFLLDASGSMGVQRRMVAVKGAIMSLLTDAYLKRDRVGLMIFRGSHADLLLPPTRSPELAAKMLKSIPTGGTTPLVQGLTDAYLLLTRGKYALASENKTIVLLSDGRGNVACTNKSPDAEITEVARKIAGTGVKFIIVDTEVGFPRLGKARILADDLKGSYFRLENLSVQRFADSIKEMTNLMP